jgi:hypothetical protein
MPKFRSVPVPYTPRELVQYEPASGAQAHARGWLQPQIEVPVETREPGELFEIALSCGVTS